MFQHGQETYAVDIIAGLSSVLCCSKSGVLKDSATQPMLLLIGVCKTKVRENMFGLWVKIVFCPVALVPLKHILSEKETLCKV